MIKTRYEPYRKYKPSNVEWIGEIPEAWEVRKVKRFFKIVNGSTPESKFDKYWDGDIVWITPDDLGNLTSKEITDSARKITFEGYMSCGTTMTRNQSIIISTRAPIGHVGLTTTPTCTNQGCKTLESKISLNSIYYYYSVISGKMELVSYGNGSTYLELSKSKLGYINLPFPTLPEQSAIANFLDRETARINGIVAKQTWMIELLKEKRSVLITQAVTKGLDPKAKMKPSGVEWIGEIPEGWDVRRLKWVIVGRLKYGANESAELDDPNLPRYIRITDFDDSGHIRGETFKSLPHEKAEGYFLSEGDILFARSGATVGKTFQFKNYKGKACFAGYLIKATPKTGIMHSDFLSYFTKSNSYESWKNAIFIQATIQNISADKYQVLQIPLPSPPEQRIIADFLDSETAKIDTLIGSIENQIELLNEYKQSLITNAVTGKIDIRGEVNAQNS